MSDAKPDKSAIRLAATVLLLRDSERGIEVFMEKRHIKSDFVGGAYVFPGGAVDPSHSDSAEELCAGLDDERASARLELDNDGLAYYVAAIRECFEEAGVLLAYDADGNLLDFGDQEVEDRFKVLRDRLNAGEITIQEIARQEGLKLATDLIEVWARWITPAGQPRRYDTYFFVVKAPERQTAAHDDWELTSSAWVTPVEALDKGAAREWMIIFPTVKNLIELGNHDTADEAIEAARKRSDLPANQPKVLVKDGQGRVVLPGDEGYEDAPEVPPGEDLADQRIWFAWVEDYKEMRASGWGE